MSIASVLVAYVLGLVVAAAPRKYAGSSEERGTGRMPTREDRWYSPRNEASLPSKERRPSRSARLLVLGWAIHGLHERAHVAWIER